MQQNEKHETRNNHNLRGFTRFSPYYWNVYSVLFLQHSKLTTMKQLLKEFAQRYFEQIEKRDKYSISDRMYFFHDGAAMIAESAYDRLNWTLVVTGETKTFAPSLTELKETK